jgi:hypothetical protein
MEYRHYLYHKETGYKRIKDPVGWDSLGKTSKRFGVDGTIGQKWHGIFFEYSTKLRYIKDGKKFLQYYYERDGIETIVLHRIEKRNPATRKFEFEYEGKVNFTSYKITTVAVEVNLENTGFLQKLKNRMDVKVNLESLESQGGKAITPFAQETVDIEMHGQVVKLQTKGDRYNNEIFESDFTLREENYDGTIYIVPTLNEAVNEGLSEFFTYPDQVVEDNPENDLKFLTEIKFAGDMNIVYKRNLNLKFKIIRVLALLQEGEISYSAKVNIVQKKLDGTRINHTLLSAPIAEDTVTFDTVTDLPNLTVLDFESGFTPVEISLADIEGDIGDQFYYYISLALEWHQSEGDSDEADLRIQDISIEFQEDNYLLFEGLTIFPATTSKTVLIHEAWTRVLQSITDTADPFRSEYFGRTDSQPVAYDADGPGGLRAYTNGNNLRLLDVPIYCSLKDLIDATMAIDGIGLGIEKSNGVERVRVEPLTYFYKAKRAIRLDWVLDIEKEVLDQLYFNQAEAGVDKWRTSTGNVNNLDEFVAPKQWTLPITQIKSMLSLRSPIITSGYMIEFARRSSTQPTKDTDRDNDPYLIQLRRDGENLATDKDQDFTSVAGVLSPETSYNLKLSPARCLRRNGRLLRAGLEKYKDQYIKFSFGEANNAMVSQLATEAAPVTEGGNILINTLDAPLFFGEVYNVRAKLTREQLDVLNTTDPNSDANVYGYIEFSDTDKSHKRGFLLEARPAADSNEVNLKLIRANV